MKHRLLTPLILALGVLCSTAICVFTDGYGFFSLAGPISLVLIIFAAIVLENGIAAIPASLIRDGLISGTTLILAGVILAAKDPVRLTYFMPIMGSAAAFTTIMSMRKTHKGNTCTL